MVTIADEEKTNIPLVANINAWWFLQDSAPTHTASPTQKMLKRKVPNFFHKDDWPGCSPDLNWIENLWAIMKESIYIDPLPTNRAALVQRIQYVWSTLDPNLLKTLARSMPSRLRQCITRSGGRARNKPDHIVGK
jgi:hypothetical protein